jgi:multicomponent Na+:H+ antiporter subunit B
MQKSEHGMSLIVKIITRLTIGLILIYGIYITLHGHLSPGGGFAGGVIVALSFIHILLAYGKEVALKNIHLKTIPLLMGIGAIVFLGISAFNFMSKQHMQVYPLKESFAILSFGLGTLYDLAVCLMTGIGLFAIFLAMALFRIENKTE